MKWVISSETLVHAPTSWRIRAACPEDIAATSAQPEKVDKLLPSIMEWPSVRRLATNPLLLTILALIHENVGRLPNRRIKLYEIAAHTLIESWRQAQSGLPDELLAELGRRRGCAGHGATGILAARSASRRHGFSC